MDVEELLGGLDEFFHRKEIITSKIFSFPGAEGGRDETGFLFIPPNPQLQSTWL
jgi:hypothetical protein